MPNDLRLTLESLAATFATAIVAAIRGSSLEHVLALSSGDPTRSAPAAAPVRRGRGRPKSAATLAREALQLTRVPSAKAPPVIKKTPSAAATMPARKSAKPGRLKRRSADQIEKALELVVALLKSTKSGLRSEQIREQLGARKEELPRVLKEGLSTKQLKSKGDKRATVDSAA